ncbi:hypothetical protein ZWY2020_009551 [Hordeum vulgare]|nr:hypothetical protein ZWY2020_009551 [Hordeum vulgare]
MGAADNNAAPRQGQQPERGRGRAPAPEQREVKVMVVDEPAAAVSRLQAQRPVAPLQVTTQAPPPPMSAFRRRGPAAARGDLPAGHAADPTAGTGLYACWVTRRVRFTARVFEKAVQPVDKFRGLNGPAYLMVAAGFVWISVWCVAVIGAVNFRFPGLTILALVVSLAWTAEVMRNVANLTASRVIALYYLRGMQSSVQFSFQRALTYNLGSACLGSLFVPTIEALRILARGLNLLEGEDEFMFSCAHCCLNVMNAVFEFGNSWAFVHIAAYGRGFVQASRSTWNQFEGQPGMPALADADITSSVCFLTGVTSGALCVALAGSWTFMTHKQYTATVSLMAFYVGYLMTRIGMALPQACVGCYYVCYAENPRSRLFEDSPIRDRLEKMKEDGEDAVGVAPTPRFPHQHVGAA